MIVKTVITVTVLHEANSLTDAGNLITSMSLADIGYMIDEGDGLGDYVISYMDEVPVDKVREESLALGNDGTFFFQMKMRRKNENDQADDYCRSSG